MSTASGTGNETHLPLLLRERPPLLGHRPRASRKRLLVGKVGGYFSLVHDILGEPEEYKILVFSSTSHHRYELRRRRSDKDGP